jgi:hypothetical protein
MLISGARRMQGTPILAVAEIDRTLDSFTGSIEVAIGAGYSVALALVSSTWTQAAAICRSSAGTNVHEKVIK